MIREAIAAALGWPRVAHPDEVRGQTSAERLDVRDDVAPEVRRRRISVKEDDRRSRSHLDESHVRVEHRNRFHDQIS